MTHYACIAIGDADFMPDEQFYISAETGEELAEIVAEQCRDWENSLAEVYPDSDEFYSYAFRIPRDGEDNYSQRLRSVGMGTRVLDVIGMTQESFERESAE